MIDEPTYPEKLVQYIRQNKERIPVQVQRWNTDKIRTLDKCTQEELLLFIEYLLKTGKHPTTVIP